MIDPWISIPPNILRGRKTVYISEGERKTLSYGVVVCPFLNRNCFVFYNWETRCADCSLIQSSFQKVSKDE